MVTFGPLRSRAEPGPAKAACPRHDGDVAHACKRLYHGGIPGLLPGDVIQPGHPRQSHPGCPICEARTGGGNPLIDPAPGRPDRVYVTEDREYARYYASLYGQGDLYRIEPVGALEASSEDLFHSHVCRAARVLAVYARAVTLTWGERRRLYRRWAALEGVTARDADFEFARMVEGCRRDGR